MLVQVTVAEIAQSVPLLPGRIFHVFNRIFHIFSGIFNRKFCSSQLFWSPIFREQSLHLVQCFFGLFKKIVKAVHNAQFKFRLSPFAPDKISGPLHFLYMALLLFFQAFYKDRTHIPFFSWLDLAQLPMKHGKTGYPQTDLIIIPYIAFSVRKAFFHNVISPVSCFA